MSVTNGLESRRNFMTLKGIRERALPAQGHIGINEGNAREILGEIAPQIRTFLQDHDEHNFRGTGFAFTVPLKNQTTGRTELRGFLRIDFEEPSQVQFLRNVHHIIKENLEGNFRKGVEQRIVRFVSWLANEVR